MIKWPDDQCTTSARVDSLTMAERERIRALVTKASEAVARNWPIRTLIARNPLEGYEHLPFEQAVPRGRGLFGGGGYLTNDEFRALYRQGRISREDLLDALRDRLPAWVVTPRLLEVGEHRIEPLEVALLHLVNGSDSHPLASSAVADSLADLWTAAVEQCAGWPGTADEPVPGEATPGPENLRTHGEVIRTSEGTPLIELVNQYVMKWCRAFLDEGLAAWPMPNRQRGFYAAWRALAIRDRSLVLLGVRDWPQTVRTLPPPEDCLVRCLRELKVPESAWVAYLSRHLAHLPGWAGFIRWRALQPDYPMQRRFPMDLTEYAAVRLVYEAVLADMVTKDVQRGPTENHQQAPLASMHGPDERHAAPDSSKRSAAWQLFQLARFLGISGPGLRHASSKDRQALLAILRALPPGCHGPIWQQAYEGNYRRALLKKLLRHPILEPRPSAPPSRPDLQAVFCIDVRSEVFRRHLETQGRYETLGFAGFFGVPLRFRPFDCDREEDQLLCPVLF